jgi:hypothetical protein
MLPVRLCRRRISARLESIGITNSQTLPTARTAANRTIASVVREASQITEAGAKTVAVGVGSRPPRSTA